LPTFDGPLWIFISFYDINCASERRQPAAIGAVNRTRIGSKDSLDLRIVSDLDHVRLVAPACDPDLPT